MAARNKVPENTPVRFSYSSHLLEDLGVNLYTSLSKALVEFVANAYDADAPLVRINFDQTAIDASYRDCKEAFDNEKHDPKNDKRPPLESRTLNPNVAIVIEDFGHGMTKDELETKLLVIGRRRRKNIVGVEKSRSRKRIIMGRKGLGKLAGFGIAHKIEILSRAKGQAYSTKITLDYDALVNDAGGPGATGSATQEVPTMVLKKGGLLKAGTKITLSRLVYQSARSADTGEVLDVLGRHFGIISAKDFSISVNSKPVKPTKRKYRAAYPEDPDREHSATVPAKITSGDSGRVFAFDYRLRFLEEKKYLPAMERGVRVYAHNRLAATPSMLDVNSNAHGFRYSDYLDGIVIADFIDELPTDYIATDRSDLRWDVHPLKDLRQFLTQQIARALGRFADLKRDESVEKVKTDLFTKKLIEDADLPVQRRKVAMQIATSLAASEDSGVKSSYYRETMPGIVSALSHSAIFDVIGQLQEQELPEFSEVVRELTRLTGAELDEFIRIAEVRLKGIDALEKIVKHVNFRQAKKEKELHQLLKANPWLINASFFEFLLSDEKETVLAERLASVLKIGKHVPAKYSADSADETRALGSNRRPDLVSVLANESLRSIVIIELKAPNVPLHHAHLVQLKDYMRHTRDFLRAHNHPEGTYELHGYLIGSKADSTHSGSEEVKRLQEAIDKNELGAGIRVVDLMQLLEDTKRVHREFLKATVRERD